MTMEGLEFHQQVLPQVPIGFRFDPTDEELLIHYLKKKLDDWVLCRIYEKVSHSPMVVSCQDVEPQSPDLQRTQQKSAMHKFSSFSWLLRREGPFTESILSHPTSDANNAVMSSVESSSPAAKFVREAKPRVNVHGLNDDEVSSVYPVKKKNTLNPS